jgi:hypothetical protein
VLENIFISASWIVANLQVMEKSKPFRKHTTIDVGMKTRMIHKYEGGKNVSAIACELGFALSTVNTIMKDAARIKEWLEELLMWEGYCTIPLPTGLMLGFANCRTAD